jgi:putative aldouronate transport system substrate-binding protein
MRRVSFVLAVLALAGAAAAFASGGTEATAPSGPSGSFNPSGYPIVKDKVTVNLMYSKGPTQGDWNELIYMKEMEKLTNMHMNCIAVVDTAWDEKKNLAFASGDLPDFIWGGISIKDEFTYGVEGKVLQSYNDLIDKYAPNIRKMFGKYTNMKAKLSAIDGKIYQLPYVADTLTVAHATMYVRTDWLKRAGIEKPTTLDGYYSMLKAFQKLDPSYIPLSISTWDNFKLYMMGAFGPQTEVWYGEDAQHKAQFVPATDQFRRLLEYLNRLYAEKLMDQETFTQKTEAVYAKTKENKVGAMTTGTMFLLSNFPSGHYDVELVKPLVSQYSSTPRVQEYPGYTGLGYGGMTNKHKYPEAMMRWIDINYSDEDVAPGLNCLSVWLGIRGVTWDYTNPEKTFYKRIIPADTKYSEVEYMTQKVSPGWGLCKLAFMATPTPEASVSQYMKASESVKNFFPYDVPGFPMSYLRYTKAEQDRLNVLRTDLETYVKQMEAKFISGTEPLSNWDAYIATLKKIGVDEAMTIIQAAYDRFLKNIG